MPTIAQLKQQLSELNVRVPSAYRRKAEIEELLRATLAGEIPTDTTRKISTTSTKSTKSTTSTSTGISGVSDTEVPITIPQNQDLLDAMENCGGNLANIDFDSYPFTDVLRFATFSPECAAAVLKATGLRGLPLDGKYELFPHQVTAMTFMREREANPHCGMTGGILSLKMGLGKSLTTAAHILTSPKGEYPTLIVGSKTVVPEWGSQCFKKFFGATSGTTSSVNTTAPRVLYFHKDLMSKLLYETMTPEKFKEYDVVMTTYDVLKSLYRADDNLADDIKSMGDEHTLMKGKVDHINTRTLSQLTNYVNKHPDIKGPISLYYTPWERVVCDESQAFANPKTKTYEAVMALYGKYKWCLSGTPIRNFNTDIFAQFRFLGFDKVKRTIDWTRNGEAHNRTYKLSTTVVMPMGYEEAGVKLPKKTEHTIPKVLHGHEKIYYEGMLGEVKTAMDQFDNRQDYGNSSFAVVLELFLRLRQSTIAPCLTSECSQFKSVCRGDAGLMQWAKDRKGTAGIRSTKITGIIDVIKSIPRGEKFIVFSNFSEALSLIGEAMDEFVPEISFAQVDGKVTGNDRTQVLDAFRSESGYRGLLMSYKVGSEGLNLVEANHCIFVEPWWNDAVHNQARARVYRTGQVRDTHVYAIQLQNTIEERVMEICANKMNMATAMLEGAEKVVTRGIGKDMLRDILNKW